MAGWTSHTGSVVTLLHDNIDTDQIIPARFMSRSRLDGYGDYLFHDLRKSAPFDKENSFPLDTQSNASILLVGNNFGTGSSREAAVYALVDAGFKVVISTSIADIFSSNAINNGLLPIRLPTDSYQQLCQFCQHHPLDININVERREITFGSQALPFDLDTSAKTKLINGWDDIDLTKAYQVSIDTFAQNRQRLHAWTQPAPDNLSAEL